VDAIVHVLRCFEDGRRHPCRGPRRSHCGCRNGRDGSDARRSRQPREARSHSRQEGAAGRQGGEGAGLGARARRWSFSATRSRRGSPSRRTRRSARRWTAPSC
jgi:hypothetical protein